MSAMSLSSGSARCAEPIRGGAPEASQHFQTGLAEAKLGNTANALREFEKAYASQPHFSVLYNIGQAQGAVGRPVEAIATFERYLAEGGAQIPESRRTEVAALIEFNRQMVGELKLVVPPVSDSRVWIDGQELEPERLTAPVSLAQGAHTVLFHAPRCDPQSKNIDVQGQHSATVSFEVPASCPLTEAAPLVIECAVPDVTVQAAGLETMKTPITHALRAPVGSLDVLFHRPGYTQVRRKMEIRAGEINRLNCAVQPVVPLPPGLRSSLEVLAEPSDVRVFIDGRPFRGSPIPAGKHVIRVDRPGFIGQQGSITLTAGTTIVHRAVLSPNAETRARIQQRKKVAIVLGAAGVGALGGALGLYVWNVHRYDAWKNDSASMSADESRRRAVSIQRTDDGALGLAFVGAISAALSSWLIFEMP